MPIFKHYDFEEIIDIEFLQSIQDKFTNILGIPTTTVDEKETLL